MVNDLDIIITGFDDEGIMIAQGITARGVVGLRYIKSDHKEFRCNKVVSLNSYREQKEYYNIAIIILTEDNINEHLGSIKGIRKQSDIVLAYIANVDSKNQSLHKLIQLVDAVFPVTSDDDPAEDVYWSIRALIEAFTVQGITGVDYTDIADLTRNSGLGLTVQFDISKDENVIERLEQEIHSQLTKRQLLCAYGALISSTGIQGKMQTGMHDVQFSTEYFHEQSNFNMSCVINVLEDTEQTNDGARRIILIFTGIC